MTTFRVERDSMGEMQVPQGALWGASTQRAVANFPISGRPLPAELVRALGLVKLAAVRVNRALGALDPDRAAAIEAAAREVAENRLDAHFVVDVFQTGSGTSSNMNANEVIANRAIQLRGGKIGDKSIHPNDDVNRGQSSNDVFPTAIHVAAAEAIERRLLPALRELQAALEKKARDFWHVIKIGRTHLMDATPIRLGQEVSGWASQVEHGIAHVEAALPHLRELAIGGTAVGTGINTTADFGSRVAAELAREAGIAFIEARNHFEAQAAQDALVAVSGALKTVAVSLMKVANDVRLLGMGPRCGLGELKLPATQPGSSIMPGKVNPVICESVIQVAAQVQANDLAVQLGGQWSQLDLNTMMPLMARNLLESIALLANVSRVFVAKCIAGLEADEERCRSLIESSLAMVTSLNPLIGYDAAAKVAKEAHETRKTVREVVRAKRLVSDKDLEKALDPEAMTGPSAAPSAGSAG
jgi:fumarate hydratase class II